MKTPEEILNECAARIARADNEALASARAFQLGPDAFAAHLDRVTKAELEEFYVDSGIGPDPRPHDPAAGTGPVPLGPGPAPANPA